MNASSINFQYFYFRNLLLFEDGESKWYLPKDSEEGKGFHNIKVRLPQYVTCDQCVLQWRYRTGKNTAEFWCLHSTAYAEKPEKTVTTFYLKYSLHQTDPYNKPWLCYERLKKAFWLFVMHIKMTKTYSAPRMRNEQKVYEIANWSYSLRISSHPRILFTMDASHSLHLQHKLFL